MKNVLAWLSLFASSSTLICCALPSLLVGLGLGATMAGLVTTVPSLILFSKYKVTVFIISGSMLLLSGLLQYQARSAACPTSQELATTCQKSKKWSLAVYIISCILWCTGAFFAFLLPAI